MKGLVGYEACRLKLGSPTNHQLLIFGFVQMQFKHDNDNVSD